MSSAWAEWASETKAELRLPFGPKGGGFLTVWFGATRVSVEFTPAKVEMLRVLNRALLADAELHPMVRGWRSPSRIAAQLSHPPSAHSVHRTVSRMNRQFHEAAALQAPHVKVPPLLRSRRQIGIRLSWSLSVLPPDAM